MYTGLSGGTYFRPVLPFQSVDVGGGEGNSESQECWRLMELVQLQSREIHHLKEEIQLLSLKGGHILPPSQPPTSSQLPPLH